MKSLKSRAHQKGNGLVFSLLGIALLGLLGAGAVALFGGGTEQINIETSVNEHNVVFSNVKTNFGPSGYVGVTTANAAAQGVFAGMRDAAGTGAVNRWSGAVTCVDNNATLPLTVLCTSNGVPQDECARFVNGTHLNARAVSVAGTVVKAVGAASPNPTTLGTQCQSAATVAVAYTIGK